MFYSIEQLKEQLIIFLLIIPILGFIILLVTPKKLVQVFALLISLLNFFFGSLLVYFFDKNKNLQFIIQNKFIKFLGIETIFAIDGISLYFVFLVIIIIPLLILSIKDESSYNHKVFYSLLFIIQFAIIGVFTTQNVLLFYIFWELSIIPIIFIILFWGDYRNETEDLHHKIILKFFLYTFLGSLSLFFCFFYLYAHTPPPLSYSFVEIAKVSKILSVKQQSIIFIFLFFAFAVKVPIIPWHTWQARLYSIAPTPATILLAALLLKMGVYGYIRLLIPILPQGVNFWQSYVIILLLFGMVYAGIVALKQNDFKKLIAYSSLSHLAISTSALFVVSNIGLQGVIIQTFTHGFIILSLLTICEIIQNKTNTRNLDELGGLFKSNPAIAFYLMFFTFANISFPLMGSFIGEILILKALFTKNIFYGLIGSLGLIIGAVYMLRAYQKIILGKSNFKTQIRIILDKREKIVLAISLVIILSLGLFPSLIFSNTENISQLYIQNFESFFIE